MHRMLHRRSITNNLFSPSDCKQASPSFVCQKQCSQIIIFCDGAGTGREIRVQGEFIVCKRFPGQAPNQDASSGLVLATDCDPFAGAAIVNESPQITARPSPSPTLAPFTTQTLIGGNATTPLPTSPLDSSRPKRTCLAPKFDPIEDAPAQEVLRSVTQEIAEMRSFNGQRVEDLAAPMATFNVYWHVIFSGGKARGNGNLTRAQIQEQIKVVNEDFKGFFRFNLVNIDYTIAPVWFHYAWDYHMPMFARLHMGTMADVNIYSVNFTMDGVLGYAYYPWSIDPENYEMDAVVVNYGTMPGNEGPYGLGRTLTHEIGHWLGLMHTFEGGCDDADEVEDTPPISDPNFGCDMGFDSCPDSRGRDRVNNYMDYTDDLCMNTFTAGQYDRMLAVVKQYRREQWRRVSGLDK
ncbi:hypothetical protein BC829DRAFT_490387 [Chytridium lagenaria]|nr:hypothetical protein BC829DRAFT_490387 [Chytridium lagenaria]